MQELKTRLDQLIASRAMLSHSFYTRWQKGELSREELQGYAKEYYQFEREFPRFLSAIHSRCEDIRTRQLLLENLMHEEGGEANHPELWLQFAEGMGVPREEVKSHFHSDETEHLLRVFRKHATSENVADGIASLYAYERQQPEVAGQKIEGLERFYGAQGESTVAFFKAHEKYDVQHSGTEMELLSEMCQTEAAQERVAGVVKETLDALYDFLDGVERRYRKAA